MSTRTLAVGSGEGEVLVLDEPLSFWGGIDPADGRIVDPRHPQFGRSVAGRVLVVPGGRGSSSSSTTLAEAIRSGTAPVAIVLTEVDAIIALGSIAADELYGAAVPVVVATDPPRGGVVRIEATSDTATIDVR